MSTRLSPYTIKTLLHVYAIAERFADRPLALQYSLQQLEVEGLIEPNPNTLCEWSITAKGEHHVKALCSLPLPTPKWITPGTTYLNETEGDS